jgi:hypothetical protein
VDDKPTREAAVRQLIKMLSGLVRHAAKEKLARSRLSSASAALA